MRYQTFDSVCPVVGTTNEPLVAPLVGAMNGCTCVSWWKSTRQVKAEAGRLPFSGSDARARVRDRLPAAVERAGRGRVIVAVGAWFDVTVSVAALLTALPALFVTRARNRAPLSAAVHRESV